jgi:hypothetical protein
MMGDLQGFISTLKVPSESANRIILESDDRRQRAALRLNHLTWPNAGCFSAYDKNVRRSTGETTVASGTLAGEGTAAPSDRRQVPLSSERTTGVPETPSKESGETPSPNIGAPDSNISPEQSGVDPANIPEAASETADQTGRPPDSAARASVLPKFANGR